jgi:hypothetical protein
MKVVPGGLTKVHLDIGSNHLFLMASSILGHRFDDLLRALYYLYPENKSDSSAEDIIEYKYGICEQNGDRYEIVKIVDSVSGQPMPLIARDLPWKTIFKWDEEGSTVNWLIEREATADTDFTLYLKIEISRLETEVYFFQVRYKDFCYAVAKACTEVIKKYGLYGFYCSTDSLDLNIRILLFLKSVALDHFEALELTQSTDKQGEYSPLEKEIELLMFDM